MPDLHLWTGLPGAGRRDTALARARAVAADGHRVWWVVDHQRQVEDVEAALLAAGPALAGVDVLIAGRLPGRLLDMAGIPSQAVAPDVRVLVLRSMLLDTGEDSDPDTPREGGWASRISRLFDRLNGGDDSARSLADRLAQRHRWLDRMVGDYRRRLDRADRRDEAELPARALAALREGAVPGPWPELLVIDRIAPAAGTLDALLQQLARQAPRAIVLLDDHPSAPALARSRDRLRRWQQPPPDQLRPFPVPPGREGMAARLFGPASAETASPDMLPAAIITHHLNPVEEVRAALRDLAAWQQEHAAPSSGDSAVPRDDLRAAIVIPAREPYAPLLRDLAPSYGLRLDLPWSEPLLQRPLGALARDLLALRVRGFEREAVVSLLLDPRVRFGETLASTAAVLDLDDAAREAGVRGGRGELDELWVEPLRRHIRRLRDQAARRLEEADEDEESVELAVKAREAADRLAERLGDALSDLRHLAGLIDSLPDPCSPVQWRRWLDEMLRELGVFRSLARDRGERDERLTLARLDVLANHLEDALTLRGLDTLALGRLAGLVEEGLGRLHVTSPRRLRGGVPVLMPEQLRGRRPERLIVLGMVDAHWPRSGDPDPLDPFRGPLDHPLDEARELLLEAVLVAGSLRFTVPVPAEGEHDAAPSPLLADLVEAGAARVEASPDEDLDSPSVDIFGVDDLLPRLGRGLASGDPDRAEAARKQLATALAQRPDAVFSTNLRHAVHVEALRQDPASLTRYEGQLQGTGLAAALAEEIAERSFSPSRLDRYAKCPMQFFHQFVLGVEAFEEEVEDEVDPMEYGSLVHGILAEGVLRLMAGRGGDVDLTVNRDEVETAMREAGEELLARRPDPSLIDKALARHLLRGLADGDQPAGPVKGLLLKAWAKRKDNPLHGDQLARVEASFGITRSRRVDNPGHELLHDSLPVGPVADPVELTGIIDLLSWDEDGWRVWDYKTGSTLPNVAAIQAGLSFQFPVYLWALQAAMDRGVLPRRDLGDPAAAYLALKKQEGQPASVSSMLKRDKFSEASNSLRDRVVQIRDAVRAGRFHHPLSQDNRLCPSGENNRCPFRRACRRDHQLFAQRDRLLADEALDNAYLFPFQRLAERGEEGR